MDLLESILTFFNLSGSIIGIVAIIIVIWDHYKDDNLLTKRVQFFYETIENLIFTFYKEEVSPDSPENENVFHHSVLMQMIDKYGKYIGLFINPERDLLFVNFSIKNIRYILNVWGKFMEGAIESNGSSSIGGAFYRSRKDPMGGYTELNPITDEEIFIISKYLENLRDYWMNNYSKRKIFRKGLKPKLDFSKLKEFLDGIYLARYGYR